MVAVNGALGGHCTHDGFYMHQVPLVYMVVFGQRRRSLGKQMLMLIQDAPSSCEQRKQQRLCQSRPAFCGVFLEFQRVFPSFLGYSHIE